MGAEDRLGRIRSAVIGGVDATLVAVEVHRGNGLPRQTIVGLPGSAVRESLDRIHAACAHSGLTLAPRRTTVNLAPAGHRKSGAGLDLPIALALLAADGVVDRADLADVVCLGELSLDGRVRPISGVLPVALAARRAGRRTLLVPVGNAAEAAAVPDLRVLPVTGLREAVAWADGEERITAAEPTVEADGERGGEGETVDLADIRGHRAAKRALEVAAAGGHHVLMTGPPGAGKTLLARALAGLLPSLSFDEALEASAVHSVTGGLVGRGLLRERPFRAPHHSVTAAGLAGGGSPLRPGEISLATHGLLFLDELPEFRRAALEVLRQPLEEGRILLSRANESHEFPARFQMVAAMNECPCGRGPADQDCRCGPHEIARYWRRVSGPLVDRMDLFLAIERVALDRIIEGGGDGGEPSATVRERVIAARGVQRARMEELRRTDPRPPAGETNAALPARSLEQVCGLAPAIRRQAREMAERLRLSARAWHRVLRVARTVADLDGADEIARRHLTEALQYRKPVTPGVGGRDPAASRSSAGEKEA